MITGYYLTQSGERWQLIRQDELYRDEVVLDGLPPERAVKVYWRYMRDFLKERARRERQPEPTLFPLVEDARPVSQRKAAGRLREPTLFDV